MIPGTVPIAGGSYGPAAVNFNGSTWLTHSGGFASTSDSSKGTLSVWFKIDPASLGGDATILCSGVNGGTTRFFFGKNSNDEFSVFGQNTSNATRISIPASGTPTPSTLPASVWTHMLASWDHTMGAPTWTVYYNDALYLSGGATVGGAIDYTQSQWNVGSDVFNNVQFWQGDMGELFFHAGQWIDLSVTANRRKFITVGGAPANLGADGSAPFGAQPTVYLSGDASNFGTNRGVGGALTVGAGALTTATTKPHL